jgi:hypothetical protein
MQLKRGGVCALWARSAVRDPAPAKWPAARLTPACPPACSAPPTWVLCDFQSPPLYLGARCGGYEQRSSAHDCRAPRLQPHHGARVPPGARARLELRLA